MICCALAPLSSHADTPLDLAAYRGKVVYLDFWASWCAPCRQSFPWMESEQRSYLAKGLVVIGVNLDQEHDLAERFLHSMETTFPIAYDPKGTLAERFKVTGMPSSFLIDKHGEVRFSHQGFRDDRKEQLDSEIRTLLAE